MQTALLVKQTSVRRGWQGKIRKTWHAWCNKYHFMSKIHVTGLDHLQVAIPKGGEDAARAFYGAALGLREVPKPTALAGRGGAWFVAGDLNLHLGVEDPFRPALKAHPAFRVTDIDAAHAALIGLDPDAITALPGVRRFFVNDPFGNRVEIVGPA